MQLSDFTNSNTLEKEAISERNDKIRQRGRDKLRLNQVDLVIIKALLTSKKVSSIDLARETQLPLTTIARRKRRLEEQLLVPSLTINLKMLDLQKISVLVSIKPRIAALNKVTEGLLAIPNISKVTAIFGTSKWRLMVEGIISTTSITSCASIVNSIQQINGVDDLIWFTDLDEIARNDYALLKHIES